jgi:hypothetical protein
MRRVLIAWVTVLATVSGYATTVPSANAQAHEISVPPGSMEWQYECHAGVACPTACSSKGDQIFTTANYASVTIFRLPNRVYWFRIDTGNNMVEYFLESDQLVCSITGADRVQGCARLGFWKPPAARQAMRRSRKPKPIQNETARGQAGRDLGQTIKECPNRA